MEPEGVGTVGNSESISEEIIYCIITVSSMIVSLTPLSAGPRRLPSTAGETLSAIQPADTTAATLHPSLSIAYPAATTSPLFA